MPRLPSGSLKTAPKARRIRTCVRGRDFPMSASHQRLAPVSTETTGTPEDWNAVHQFRASRASASAPPRPVQRCDLLGKVETGREMGPAPAPIHDDERAHLREWRRREVAHWHRARCQLTDIPLLRSIDRQPRDPCLLTLTSSGLSGVGLTLCHLNFILCPVLAEAAEANFHCNHLIILFRIITIKPGFKQ